MRAVLNSFVAVFCLSATILSYGQTHDSKPSEVKAQSCEYLKNALDYGLAEARKIEDSNLILILRPGSDERSKSLSITRERFILNYLRFRDREYSRLVIAQGQGRDPLGKLEIYVNGKLEWELFFRKNGKAWDSCVE
jgi:hypothetical protein